MLNGKFVNPGYEYTYQDWVIGIIKTEDLENLLENGKISQLDYDTIQHLQEEEDKENITVPYQYTYEDWLNGKINPIELEGLFINKELNSDIYTRILQEQDEAFLKRLADSIEALKREFLTYYNDSLVKEDYLDAWIKKTELRVKAIREEKEEIYLDALYGYSDGRRNLTAKQVSEYLSYDGNGADAFTIYNTLLKDYIYDNTPFSYILKVNYLKWLNWKKEVHKQDKTEPAINMQARTADRDIKQLSAKTQLSYNWLNNPITELPELYQLLIDKNLIHAATTLEQFKAIFTAKPLLIIDPIKWHDDNASELLYFILQLESSDNIERGKQTNYQRLKDCFVKPDGTPFDSAFKSLKTRINTDLSEPKQQTIREIIDNFK